MLSVTLFLLTRLGKESISRIAASVTLKKKAVAKTRLLRPLAQQQSNAIKSQSYGVAPVVLLFLSACPTAVFKTIASVVVFSVQTQVAGGGSPHVIEKIGEVVPSWVFYFYSASAIILIGLIALVVASLNHALPSVIYPRARHIVKQAAAAFYAAAPEMITSCDLSVSAIALAKPKSVSVFSVGGKSDNRQLTKSLSGYIFYSSGDSGRIEGIHNGLLCRLSG